MGLGPIIKELAKKGIKWVGGKLSGKGKPPAKPQKAPNPPGKKCVKGCKALSKTAKKPGRRHSLCQTKGNDPAKDKNSMLDPSVDVADDMAKLNGGDFTRAG